jgi:hypothetical protein
MIFLELGQTGYKKLIILSRFQKFRYACDQMLPRKLKLKNGKWDSATLLLLKPYFNFNFFWGVGAYFR